MFWLIDSFHQMIKHCATVETIDPSRNFKFIILYSCLLHSVYTAFVNQLDERPIMSATKKAVLLVFFASTYCFG